MEFLKLSCYYCFMNRVFTVILTIISLFILVYNPVACAKSTLTPQVVRTTFTFNEKLVPGSNTTLVKLTVLLPQTLRYRQKILNIRYSHQPLKIYNANGNKYAYFEIKNLKEPVTVKVNVDAELYKYDLNIAKTLPQKDFADKQSLQEYLKEEPALEFSNPLIQSAANSINGANDLDTIQKIFDFTAKTIKFGGYNPVSVGAIKAITDKVGDCTEFSDLFVALCRAKGIPARVIYGYTTSWSDTPKHAWVEAYTKQYGWVPFDPTVGRNDLSRFSNMANKYIYLSYYRNDNNLLGYYYASYYYYGSPIQFVDTFKVDSIK